ncbi:sugar phosphate isomerase/epimerase family protein [Tepidibacter formicigenes]|jgi:sugar phosphate isomerase/epimerase|uniref:Sugar phosphate isomerase/epimerase n=1 Tax=Tepidibacter formicigenes DSM 15518 TaxID=1123349 RepID=A0A1M6RXP8_9FIRM|nr:sugar phosphate isomerase/epimerase [Tepidibacter formicigenes]SHK37244.1 Sugar phosphate isomerase/epimerase [Tepidibacter formicigenes DSM 15518]
MKYIGYAASIGEKSILDSMNFAVENGFNAVEINMNMKCFFPENYSIDLIKKIKKYKKENNIELTIHAPEDISLLNLHEKVRYSGIERLKEIINFAKEIDASRITIHIGTTPYFTLTHGKCYLDDIYYHEYKEILKKTLIELNNYCEKKIKLCIENSGRFPEKLFQEVLKEILLKENIFLTWDIGHSYKNLYNELDFFETNINKVKTCHIHDVNEKSDHQVIGLGKLSFIDYIKKIGFEDVVYIIEVRPREKAVESLNNLKKLIKK